MGRITDILTRCRDSLSDAKKERWSDARLIRILDEGQKDLAITAKLLRSSLDVAVLADISTYELPDGVFEITRAIGSQTPSTADTTELDRIRIPVKTHAQMDELDPAWETRVGSGVTYIAFDKLQPRQFKIYPIPSAADEVSAHIFPSDTGVVTDSTADAFVSDFGVVTDISESATLSSTFTSDLGVVTNTTSVLTSLRLYYYRQPTTLDENGVIDFNVLLEVESIFDKALKHYVVGNALRDNQDTQSRSIGNDELALYGIELAKAIKLSSRDFNAGQDLSTDYRVGTVAYNTGLDHGIRKSSY